MNNTCIGPQCKRPPKAHGLCGGHYQQYRFGKELTALRIYYPSIHRDEHGRKRCSRCEDWLPVTDFYANMRASDGLNSNCNLCDRLFKYNITAHQYRELLAKQNGTCAICFRTPEQFHIDHDHACCRERKRSCGKCIRGLLCPDCNGAIGLLFDDIARCRNAAAYLEGGEPCPS